MNNKNFEEIDKNQPHDNFKLKITSEFWQCVKLCFHCDIFIDQLIDHFMKLSMLLLSRLLHHFLEESKVS